MSTTRWRPHCSFCSLTAPTSHTFHSPFPVPFAALLLPFSLIHSISFHPFLVLAERVKALGQGLVFGSDAASFQVMV